MNPNETIPLNVDLGGAPELLIEASAGTGKTYALTTLVARLLVERRVEIGELLVVTFTLAATGELRDRLRATLRAALREASRDGTDPQAADLLERWEGLNIGRADIARRLELALLDLDRANVMTIHGFCQRALADFAFDGGLAFGFEVAGDGMDALNTAVGDEWRRWAYPASPLLVRYALANGFAADDLARWVAGYVARPDLQIVGAEASTADTMLGLDGLEEAWRDSLSHAKHVLDATVGSLSDADGDRIAGALHRSGAAFCKTSKAGYFGTLTIRKNVRSREPGLAAALDQLNRASEQLRAAYGLVLPCLRRDTLQNVRASLQRRVNEDRRLGFDDLLTGMHGALADRQDLARRIRDRYPWALIDEYQDTDRLQADIFRRIYRDTREAGDSGALIIVGDPKQSIYRFRSADIFAYIKTSKAVADARLTLSQNFRSVPALTGAVNALFEHPCPFALKEIDFAPVESAVQAPALDVDGETVAGGGDAPFQIRYVPWTDKLLLKPKMRDLAARLAADEIAALLALAARDRARLADRALRGSDVAVLVRSAEQGRTVARALHERGIASVEIGTESVMASREAKQLERLLWAIAKPQSPARTRGALTADFFGLDAARAGALQDDDNAWNAWTERLGDWLVAWQRSDVATLIRRILESPEVDGAHHLLRYRDGPRRLTNIKHLAELLQEAETRERYSPTGLAAWFTRQCANVEGRGSAGGERNEMALLRLDSDEQLVKIVTVHAAKGLEFPIVFCPFLWDAQGMRKNKWADYHGTEAEGHPDILDLAPTEESHEANHLEDFSDEIRLLYVALTRARERCVVTWTKVGQTEHAPFAWLIYGRDAAAGEVDAKTVLAAATAAKGLSPEQWRAGLDDLAARCTGDIGIAEVNPGYQSATSPAAPTRVPELEVRRLDRTLAHVRQMSSYSALVHSAGVAASPDDHELIEQPDRDDADPAEQEDPAMEPEISRDAFTFPGGRSAGNCLHRIFERLDRGEEGCVETACRESLGRYRIDLDWLGVARSLVENTRATLLTPSDGPGAGKGFRIGELDRPVPEMEFHLPLEGLDRRRLGATLAEHGHANLFSAAQSSIDGFLRGFVDLVAGHEGVWYVLDYKSNWLGDRLEGYRPEGLEKAMREHRYPLQYLLYLVALHRYLCVRLPRYDYDRNIGGAFYLFLRGIDPAAGMARGIYFDRPSRACIEALDDCFRGAA